MNLVLAELEEQLEELRGHVDRAKRAPTFQKLGHAEQAVEGAVAALNTLWLAARDLDARLAEIERRR